MWHNTMFESRLKGQFSPTFFKNKTPIFHTFYSIVLVVLFPICTNCTMTWTHSYHATPQPIFFRLSIHAPTLFFQRQEEKFPRSLERHLFGAAAIFFFSRIYTSGNANISTISLSFSFRSASPVNFGQWRESDQDGSSGERGREKSFGNSMTGCQKTGLPKFLFGAKKREITQKSFPLFRKKKRYISSRKGCRVRRNKDTSKRARNIWGTKRGSKTSSSSSSSLVTLPLCQ